MQEYSDKEIIECLRSRKSYVVRWLWDRYLQMVRMIITEKGGTSEDAKDIFQESLMIIIEKLDSTEFVLTCSFKTYFYCVCDNLWNSVLDKRRAATNYFRRKEAEEMEKSAEEIIHDRTCEEIFRESFESMDAASKKILKLYWQDKPAQEVADKLGYTYSYVRKKKCEAQAELLLRIKRHPGYRQMMRSEKVAARVVY